MRRGLPTLLGTLIAASLLASARLAAQEAPGGAPDYSAFR